jgi:hypothetical protein
MPDLSNSNYQIREYNKYFTTTYLLTKEHMSMFVVKLIVIQMKGVSRDLLIASLNQSFTGRTKRVPS